jgi:hypothetical protein
MVTQSKIAAQLLDAERLGVAAKHTRSEALTCPVTFLRQTASLSQLVIGQYRCSRPIPRSKRCLDQARTCQLTRAG